MTIVVAVDRDRNSQLAVKWVVDHLLTGASNIILLHIAVHPPAANHGFAMAEATHGALEAEMREIFVPFRGFCTRNGVHVSELVLEEADVSKALIEFITVNKIQSIALGASNRNAFTKKFKNADVPSSLMKGAPDYCNIYVVAKGKSVNVRLAKCGVDGGCGGGGGYEGDSSIRSLYTRRCSRGKLPPATPSPDSSRRSVDSRTLPELTTRPPFRERSLPSSSSKPVVLSSRAAPDCGGGGVDGSYRSTRRSVSNESFVGDLDFGQSSRFSSMDFCDSLDMSSLSASPRESSSPLSAPQREVEVEMRRLRLELKQTMTYGFAMAEATHGALEAEMREIFVPFRGFCTRNGVRALDAISSHDFRYRRYNIDDIELATERFSDELKIGEGGYGPVYRASLDHTPVAIKVLRPDAQQGRKQFQQEVEVLSCIRHPNMVLLLGACPDYGCLVYEYMDNGSLEDRLFRRGGTPPIPWSQRFRISAEIATALLFLHQTKPEPLVHRDLKPANILLDRNYVSKISDVGLARLVPPAVADSVTQYRLTATAGTFCYIDPEYQQTGKLGVKSDIYSLGVLLLQVLTARPPMGLTHHVEKAIDAGTFAQMLDVTVKDWPVDDAIGFAKLALKCTEMRRRDRPDLATVILPELNRLRNLGHAYEARMSAAAADAAAHAQDNVGSPTVVGASWRTAES
ncbi:hypothetical protein OsI_02560 [Oryza sativa Indica Group]|uniref:RING-type E3 ubiquitin transferase n=1 Tax=Oryza sativa subsp. indica TaxID=39946 RepID=A2WRR9_ORYSI|nr:hypothetical protein OsI_02560 [Oryza sativa Indica Group]